MQDYYISKNLDENIKLEQYLKENGATKIIEYQNGKSTWKYNDYIIEISKDGSYEIRNILPYALANNEIYNDIEAGFLIDINLNVEESKRAIARKKIKSINISPVVPEDFNVSYDVSAMQDSSVILYAIKAEGEDMYDVTIVPTNGEMVYTPYNSNSLFSSCNNLKSIDLKNLDTSYTEEMFGVFFGCSSISSLDLSSFNTSNVNTMQSMFYNCTSLKEINLNSFDTSKTKDMENMFAYCSSLEQLNLINFDTSKVTSMVNMFIDCSKLEKLDISKFNTENVTAMTCMFQSCRALKELDLTSFNTKNVERMEYMFFYCTNLNVIYVSDTWIYRDTVKKENMFLNCKAGDVTLKSN